MGLDMFLNKHVYFYGWDDDQKKKIGKCFAPGFLESIGANIDTFKSITIEAMYWRKANAIHGWFVEKVQEGEDNCGEYYVSEEQLQQLYDAVCRVLEAKGTPEQEEIISEVGLEPVDGFFFGSDQIDDWYWEDLEQTKVALEPILDHIRARTAKLQAERDAIELLKAAGKKPPKNKDLAFGESYYYHSSW